MVFTLQYTAPWGNCCFCDFEPNMIKVSDSDLSQSLRLLTSLYTQFFYMIISATERVEGKNKTLYLFNLQFVFGTSIVARTKSGAHKYQVLLTEARRGAASLKWDFGKGYLKMKAYLKQRIHWEAASRTIIKQIRIFFFLFLKCESCHSATLAESQNKNMETSIIGPLETKRGYTFLCRWQTFRKWSEKNPFCIFFHSCWYVTHSTRK